MWVFPALPRSPIGYPWCCFRRGICRAWQLSTIIQLVICDSKLSYRHSETKNVGAEDLRPDSLGYTHEGYNWVGCHRVTRGKRVKRSKGRLVCPKCGTESFRNWLHLTGEERSSKRSSFIFQARGNKGLSKFTYNAVKLTKQENIEVAGTSVNLLPDKSLEGEHSVIYRSASVLVDGKSSRNDLQWGNILWNVKELSAGAAVQVLRVCRHCAFGFDFPKWNFPGTL